MKDPFLDLPRTRPEGRKPTIANETENNHSGRAHSKFSASGAERWINCPGSVALSEGLPDKSSPWAEEGTRAHEVLEKILTYGLNHQRFPLPSIFDVPREMVSYGIVAAKFITDLAESLPNAEVLVEDRVHLDFIHPDMFGTYDAAVIDHFGTLHVFDYKYGAGHAVQVKDNLQMLFYALGLAHQFKWNFKAARMWIIQPRIRGYDGPTFWEVPIKKLAETIYTFDSGVRRVEKEPDKYVEGPWCHFCRARSICPLKTEKKTNEAKMLFTDLPIRD